MKERQATKQEREHGKTPPTETPTMLDQKVLYCTPRPGNQQPATAFVTLARPIQSNWTRSRTRPGDARDGSLAMKLLCNAAILPRLRVAAGRPPIRKSLKAGPVWEP